MEELTNRQKSILSFIQEEIQNKGYPPSVREIGDAVGLKSPASVHSHLKTLEKYDYIRRDPSKPRAIEVLYNKDGIENVNKEMIDIPLVGTVTAGAPILAEENIEDFFPVPVQFLSSSAKDLFMLEISGESMIEAGIYDGDYVIAQRQNYANNKDIIIALLEEGATVKRFFKEKNYIRLQPENKTMEPIIVPDVYILGKVIGLYRRFVS
ncbi:transcriptional repressor LexA [Iocasia frigidifontis]|uniref:LexA repressor n=1 Tax=Iocasia fonsfrigidae TaxID=2682810 RepID=A0A8A7KAM5_9FIRM|nr:MULTISPECIES: transcriptional repressor LexA [Halanaerobiaceae]AZO95409.1 transcriptional repressor LexA [Halocella sp. SP3-1]MTI61169.1 transcriptional repressor LexA [Bacillota bacterium]QTL98290.1 transcriptional repressor LexA [Iocasia fonsfrigidae]